MEGDGDGWRDGRPRPVLEEMSLSEGFLGKPGDGWMVDGEESTGELGGSALCSEVGDIGWRV